jgi:hypothetical protein
MKIKECYVSQNGITCITNINSLIDLKLLNIDTIKKNILFYIILRSSELILIDLIKNKNYLLNSNIETYLLPSIMFS